MSPPQSKQHLAAVSWLAGRRLLQACGVCIFLNSISLSAAGLKKVIILDFKNFDKNVNYEYLESSITDAVRNDLKSRFAFKEMAPEEWRKLAKDNYFLWPEENYTKGFAMQLGLTGRQDVVVGGFYQAVTKKKGQVIRANVFILDIGAKKLISEFAIEMPTDATLFENVTKLAARVADESKSVLPNEADFKKLGGVSEEPGGPNEFSVTGGVNMLSVPATFSDNFSSSSSLFSKDIKNAIQVEAGYTRHDFFVPHLQFSVVGGAQFGSGELKVSTDTKTIRTSLLGFSAGGHIGYRFEIWKFYLTPFAGGGFYLGSLKLDYSTLSVLPVDSTGADKSSATINISAPFAEGGVRLGFQLNRSLAFQLTAQYRQFVYIGQTAGQGFVGGGICFRM